MWNTLKSLSHNFVMFKVQNSNKNNGINIFIIHFWVRGGHMSKNSTLCTGSYKTRNGMEWNGTGRAPGF